MIRNVLLFFLLCAIPAVAFSQATPKEDDYYRLIEFPIPEHVNLEAGGLELLPDGKLAVSTRRGDIYLVDKPFADPPGLLTMKIGSEHQPLVRGMGCKDELLFWLKFYGKAGSIALEVE